MAKNLRTGRVLSCTAAVLATFAFIIACSDEQWIDIGTGGIGSEINNAEDNFFRSQMPGILSETYMSSCSVAEEPSSSSKDDDNNNNSSSNEASNRSSDGGSQKSSSSTNETSRSSSSSPYDLTCSVNESPRTIAQNSFGYNNTQIADFIKIKCKEKSNPDKIINIYGRDDVEWSGAPDWSGVTKGDRYENIKITILDRSDIEGCQRMKADCSGTLIVSGGGTSSSSRTGTSSATGGGTSSATGGTSSTTTGGSSASGGGNCFYGPGRCYTKPTGGCDEYSVEVSNCDNPSGIKYCDYGVCENGDGDGCEKGGCYLKVKSCNTGATEVNTCANDHLPPNARSSGSSGGTSSPGGGTSSSSGGSSGGNTIDLTNATNSNWDKDFDGGSYTVITGGKSQCALGCRGAPCSLTGAITASSNQDYGSMSNVNVSNGTVTISAKVRFFSCW